MIYKNGEIVWQDDTIVFCGHHYDGPCEREIDGDGTIVSPGFIDLDALVDIDHGILDVAVRRSPADRFQLSPALSRTKDVFGPEYWQTKQRLSYAQLLSNGITTGMPIAGDLFRGWAETYEEMADAAAIAAELGIRMYLGPSFRMIPRPGQELQYQRGIESFEAAIRYCEDFENSYSGLVKTFLSPCQIMNLTPDILRQAASYSRQRNIPLRLHTGESVMELEYLQREFGKTPIEYLYGEGVLGKRTLIPHAIYAGNCMPPPFPKGPNDLRLLAQTGTCVVHAPIAESHGGLCLYSFGLYANAGINLAFGTDTHPADMLQNMNFAWNLNRLFEHGDLFSVCSDAIPQTGRQVTAGDIFNASTVNAAAALGRTDIGRLAKGAKADIIMVDITPLRTVPVADPIRTLIMNTTGANVKHVFVNGRQVVKDHKVLAVEDEPRLREKAQDCFDRYRNAWQAYDVENRPADVFFPPVFPILCEEAEKGPARCEPPHFVRTVQKRDPGRKD